MFFILHHLRQFNWRHTNEIGEKKDVLFLTYNFRDGRANRQVEQLTRFDGKFAIGHAYDVLPVMELAPVLVAAGVGDPGSLSFVQVPGGNQTCRLGERLAGRQKKNPTKRWIE